jgi:hypothetical protein
MGMSEDRVRGRQVIEKRRKSRCRWKSMSLEEFLENRMLAELSWSILGQAENYCELGNECTIP